MNTSPENRRSDESTNPADLPPLDETAKVPRDKQDDVVTPEYLQKKMDMPSAKKHDTGRRW